MSRAKSIESLSRTELLSLIYNNLPRTLTETHPCVCAACGEEEIALKRVDDTVVKVYGYVCDECEYSAKEPAECNACEGNGSRQSEDGSELVTCSTCDGLGFL